MPLQPGGHLGGYRIDARLGQGGMGTVYRAFDLTLQRPVAIKVLAEADERARSKLLAEARAASALDHPNICTVHEVGEADGWPYIVMALVEGRPLGELIPADGLPPESVIRYGLQIADALAHAHDRGIIHRDLKSQNVVITPEGRAKVLDFGLAIRLEQQDAEVVTMSVDTPVAPTTIAGTLAYMAPEVLRGEEATARSDIWALGVLLYEMASGRLPFEGPSVSDVVASVLKETPTALPVRVMPGLRAIVRRALSKVSDHRYSTSGEVRAALDALASSGAVDEGPSSETTTIPSIAVLPFVSMSPDPDDAYFSDGLSEEIINALTKLPRLRVIARTSAFRFRGERDLRKVGEALGVRTVLEGSVRKAGTRVRIAAQLIDVGDDSHVWSKRFDRELTDIFAIQDEIAAAIVEELHVNLGPTGGGARSTTAPTRNLEAYEALLEGRHHWNSFTPTGADKALACFNRALALDPGYADAVVAVAFHHSVRAWMFDDPRGELGKMSALAARALALDSNSGEAHGALAFGTLWLEWDWKAADRLFRRAIALAPASAVNMTLYGVLYLLGQGRLDEALAYIDRGLKLDPFAAPVLGPKARVLLCARRFDEAEACSRRALELAPAHPLVLVELAYALAFQQRCGEALAVAREAIDIHGPLKTLIPVLGVAYALAGRRDEAIQVLDSLTEIGRSTYVTPFTFAAVYAALAELDQAFEWTERSIDEQDPMMLYLKVHPVFDALRSDPRYPALLERVHLVR